MLTRLVGLSVVEDEERRIVEGYATTESVNVYGWFTDLNATRRAIEEFQRWANVRYMHQPDAVGVVEDMSVDDKGLYVRVKVVDDVVWKKVKEGVLKAFSLGLTVLDRVWDDIKGAWRITKYQIFEVSLVDNPANQDCAYTLVTRADPDVKLGRFRKADEDAEWDGDSSKYSLEEWARACAYVKGVKNPHDGVLPDDLTKSDCKLPHHLPDGTLVWRGVAAAMGALLGARGGVDIPTGDRRRVYSHLAAHYSDFDKPVPEYEEAMAVSDERTFWDRLKILARGGDDMEEELRTIKTAVEELRARLDAMGEQLATVTDERDALKEQVAAFEKEENARVEAEAEAWANGLVTAYVGNPVFAPALKDTWKRLYVSDPDAAKKAVEEVVPEQKAGTPVSEGRPGESNGLTPAQIAILESAGYKVGGDS